MDKLVIILQDKADTMKRVILLLVLTAIFSQCKNGEELVLTAKELYTSLSRQKLLNNSKTTALQDRRFFLSVPNTFKTDVQTGIDGRFLYDYQYKIRDINKLKDFTLIVPFAKGLVSSEQVDMTQTRLPPRINC